MELKLVIALLLTFGIGLSLGLLGSGGSIVILPVLVYVADVPVTTAIGMSLAVVGGASAVGAWLKHQRGLVHWRAATLFGLSGMIGSGLGAQFTRLVSPALLMFLFAALMAAVGMRMLVQRGDDTIEPLPDCRPIRCGLAGLTVGVLTGFLGVGGGFLIVPAMIHFAGVSMPRAVGTSLAVIAANSVAGLVGQLRHESFEGRLALAFLMAALFGMTAGSRLSSAIPGATLQRLFAWFVLAIAAVIFAKNWSAFGLFLTST